MQHHASIQHLSNEQLTAELASACRTERRSTVSVLRLLAEVDRRKLYAKLGYYSLYEYCTEELHYSENEAYLRIGVARAGRRFPILLDMIDRGELHLTGASRCAPQLTEENHRELLAAVVHKSKREIEEILACWFPQPDIEDSIDPTSEQRQSVDPLSEGRYAVSFTATERCCELLERAKQLTSHRRPRPGLGKMIEEALEAYVLRLEKEKFKTTDQPREQAAAVQSEDPRYIPARVKREVYQRDEGRCTFTSSDGRRCRARAFLEYDHIVPVARGGKSTADNLRLRCFRHNQQEAVEEFGEVHMSLMATGFHPARVLANRAALMAMRPLGTDARGSADSFRHELIGSPGREAHPERSETAASHERMRRLAQCGLLLSCACATDVIDHARDASSEVTDARPADVPIWETDLRCEVDPRRVIPAGMSFADSSGCNQRYCLVDPSQGTPRMLFCGCDGTTYGSSCPRFPMPIRAPAIDLGSTSTTQLRAAYGAGPE